MKWLIPVVLLSTLGACSGDDSEGGDGDDSAAIRSAAQSYSDAYLTGDGSTAYALLSSRCRERSTAADFSALADLAAEVYGDPLPFTTFKAEVNGDQARVTYTYASQPAIDQDREPWVLEDGEWLEDDC